MAEDLQGLLDRIQSEGFKKVEEEKQEILSKARDEADRILRDAREEAEQIVANAEREREKLQQSGQEDLRQASRDVIVSLEKEVGTLLDELIRQAVGEALTPDAMAELIQQMATAYGQARGKDVDRVDALVSPADLEKLEQDAKAKLQERFKNGVNLRPVRSIDAGLQIACDGESVYHDFTDTAISDMICAYVNPRLKAILRDKAHEGQAG